MVRESRRPIDFRTGIADIGAFEFNGSLAGISGITRTGTNDATINTEVAIGHTYQLQRRADLTPSSMWSNVTNPFTASGNDFESVTDPHASTAPNPSTT